MVRKKRGQKFTKSLLHCSYLAGSTFERMTELISQSLYFHPGFDSRIEIMKQYYDNVIRFIEEVSVVLRSTQTEEKSTRFIYESFFTNLRNIATNMYDLQYLFSSRYYEFSNTDMDELISLNKTVSNAVNFFNRIIHTLESYSILDGSWHIGELEEAAKEHYRIISYNLLQSNYSWQNALLIQKMTEYMITIVTQCSEAIRKLAFVKSDNDNEEKK